MNDGDMMEIKNPIGNTQCFDIFSLRDSQQLNAVNAETHQIDKNDFPYHMIDGTFFGLSNNKLLRFCPNQTELLKDVKCPMKDGKYVDHYEIYTNHNKYPFYYPHCPCNDKETNCFLIPEQQVKEIELQGIVLDKTNIIVNHDMKFVDCNGLKSIIVNDDKVSLNFKKNQRDILYIYIKNKGFVNKQGKKVGIRVKINPYFENVYKISIKRNKNVVYLEDYKYKDYRLIETFKKSDYLQDYLKVGNEEKIYIGSDVVLIKRV